MMFCGDGTQDATRDQLLRLAAALPVGGLRFEDLRMLMARMHWPDQNWWEWSSEMGWRRCLRQAVAAGLIGFRNGRYVRPRGVYVLPRPPLKLPIDVSDPWPWPEQAKG